MIEQVSRYADKSRPVWARGLKRVLPLLVPIAYSNALYYKKLISNELNTHGLFQLCERFKR